MEPLHASTIAALTYLTLLIPAPAAPAAAPPNSAIASVGTGGVVVNEFSPGDGLFTNEFVELRNTGAQAVHIGGWDLWACLSPTTTERAVTFPTGAWIEPGERVLLAHPDWAEATSPAPDYSYDIDVPDDGGWLIHDPFSGHTDGVGLASDLDCTEGDPAPQCEWNAGVTVARDHAGTDTDDNAADFTCQPRTPGL